ncbi:MAG: hypothetical protein F6K09_21650 [Merismopedia sp. SIO2A8]|nr:hypothetical protein [Symploca sp. SIO2B6]NET51229.1 hypothetical protein [Merismopedia sp. SIO2A8]
MSSDPRDLIPAPESQNRLSIRPNHPPISPTGKIDIRRPKPSPLPHNRPIADNNTEAMDDMLSYLD